MPYPIELIRSIAGRHGIPGEPELMPDGGMVNEVWAIGDAVLRIVKEDGDLECDEEAAREAAVVPLAVAAGVKTPELIAFDLGREHAPRPYTIYARARGVLLGFSADDPERFETTYRQVGAEIAKIERIPVDDALRLRLRCEEPGDARGQLPRAIEAGCLSSEEAARFEGWIELLEPLLGREPPKARLFHNDIHAWNLMADPDTRELTAILDWGDASFGDVARDFAALPGCAVRPMLAGYRDAGGRDDPGLRARLLHVGIEVTLWELRVLAGTAFDRRWWRLPLGGFESFQRELHELLAE